MTRACKLAPLVGLTVMQFATPALAEDYRAEASASVASVDNDGADGESAGLQGTYYLGEVGTKDVPLSEAAFLGRVSRIRLEGERSGIDGELHTNAWMLSSDIYVPTRIPLFVSAEFARSETLAFNSGTLSLEKSGHNTAWNAAIGVTPIDGLRVSTRFFENVDYRPNVDLRYVGKLGVSHWFGFGVELSDQDFGGLYWNLIADYFLDESFKVGAAYNDGYAQWALIGEKFFNRRASIGVVYSWDEFADAFRLEASLRF